MIQYQYQAVSGVVCAVTIVGQSISIPLDPQNTDYQQFLAWVAEGNTPLPPDPPSPIP